MPAAIPVTADAPDSLRRSDFRLNPPEVEDIAVRRVSGSRVQLEVRFANDPRLGRELTLSPDESPIVLRDDGTQGDAQGGDHVFTGQAPGNFDSLAAGQAALLRQLLLNKIPPRLFQFRGREVVRVQDLDRAQIAALSKESFVRLIQLGGLLVDEHRSLVVTDPTVVEDPNRTFNPCSGAGTPGGKWTFGYLMRQMANEPKTGINPSDFVQRWLQHWLTTQSVNSFGVPARAQMQAILTRWPKLADGRLDIDRAPVKLLAIVNRIDLATNVVYGRGNAGEGRFVFGVMNTANGACSPMPFTIILEYGVPKHTCMEIKAWAKQWLDLGQVALTDPAFNPALEAITEQFAKADADPSKPNGSAINQVRTDEIALAGPWELREFRIFDSDSDAGQLREVTVKQTPDQFTYNGSTTVPGPHGASQTDLGDWINTHEADVIADRHSVPADLPFPLLKPFLGGASPNNPDFWNASNINTPDARFHFSLNTCNACHGRETNTGFTHVSPAAFGQEAQLSGFMKGDGSGGPFPVNDPVTGAQHGFFDLQHRAQVLSDFATQPCFLFVRFRPILMTH